MIRSTDLLKVAKDAVTLDATPAGLARAVSTMYYALFHAMLETARSRVAGCQNAALLTRYTAAFGHGALADAANQVLACVHPKGRGMIKGGALAPWTGLFALDLANGTRRLPHPDLLEACAGFTKLQELRHQADYHADWNVTFAEAQQHLSDAERTIEAWQRCANGDDALIFLFGSLGVLAFRK